VTPYLDAADVDWVAPDLPSVADAAGGANQSDDNAVVREALDGLPGTETAILLGHSRGGTVITEAGTHDRVGHLVYLAAFLGLENEDTMPYRSEGLNECLEFQSDGTVTVKPELGKAVFYNEHDESDFLWAQERLRSQSFKPFEDDSELAWQNKPSTYVVCRRDNALPVAGQRKMAARATQSIEWDTDHSPFVYRPELVATLLIGMSVTS
tara:strand:+ start:703 stop:1332 length:630 start_codon:yes stop_codon:yes gene_type:complete